MIVLVHSIMDKISKLQDRFPPFVILIFLTFRPKYLRKGLACGQFSIIRFCKVQLTSRFNISPLKLEELTSYLLKEPLKIHFCIANGAEFKNVAYCLVSNSSIMKDGIGDIPYYGELISILSGEPIGTLEYSIKKSCQPLHTMSNLWERAAKLQAENDSPCRNEQSLSAENDSKQTQFDVAYESGNRALSVVSIEQQTKNPVSEPLSTINSNEPNLTTKTMAGEASSTIKTKIPSIRILVHEIQFETNQSVKSLLQRTKQVYIALEIFGIVGEQLETESVALPSTSLKFNYSKSFDFESILSNGNCSKESILTSWTSQCLQVTLIDEPSPDEDRDCQDIGHASLNLSQLPSECFNLDLLAADNATKIGIISLQIAGMMEFKTYLDQTQ